MKHSFKFMKAAATFVILSFMLLHASAITLAASYDIASGSIIINDNNDYTISGTSSGAEVVTIIGGQPIITIQNLNILATSAPAIDVQAGNVTLIVNGANTLRGGRAGNIGLAGIRVAVGATLTITADGVGSLQVTGGDGNNAVAGAGIGSSGGEPSFGTIIINSGEISANGGTPNPVTSITPTAGAGIGSGGTMGGYPLAVGVIEINGGTIHAVGGYGNTRADTIGGAGIGSGANNSGADSYIQTTILGGTITAQAGMDAAGIGGGSNIPSGPIYIGGTSVVHAYGASSSGTFGGAGIGGGDNCWTQGITITGNSKVLAVGAGTAAGIGGGMSEGNWGGDPGDNFSYTISGNASVVAIGGSSATRGGAGIGSAYLPYSFGSMGGIINILDHAKVEAYGGIGANAIGNGFIPSSVTPINDPVNITISSTANVRAFTANAAQPAIHENVSVESPATLYSYTGTPVGVNTATDVTTPSGLGLTWTWDVSDTATVEISNNLRFSATNTYLNTIYNWAYLEGEQSPLPVIISEDTTTATSNTPFSFQVKATNDPISFTVEGTLPDGVIFDNTTGVLSGTPAPGTDGSYPLIITAINAAGESEPQNFTLIVTGTGTMHTIIASAGQYGTISPAGNVTVLSGGSQTFRITPNQGYAIDTVTVDGQTVAATTVYTFSDVQADHTIHVTFKLIHVPHTGDSGNLTIWLALVPLSAFTGLCAAAYKKRRADRR